MTNECATCRSLSEVASGVHSVVRRLEGGRSFTSRLAAMGLVKDVRLEVLQNSGHGPVLVRVHNTRVALGRNEARQIIVEEIAE